MTTCTYIAKRGVVIEGDVKGAWLIDGTAETIVGSELVTNGDFATDTDWTKGVGWSIAAGVASCDGTQTGESSIYQSVTWPDTGYQVVLSFEIVSRSAGSIAINVGGVAGAESVYFTATGYHSVTITMTGVETSAGLLASVSFIGTVDNMSVRLAIPDLSSNNNGLGVHGTLAKSPVNTGAGMVGYSGYSAANYLQQPYSVDLDYGTGDFYCSFWIKTTASSGYVLDRGHPSGANDDNRLAVLLSSGTVWFYTTEGSGATSSLYSASVINDGDWHSVCVARVSGEMHVYIDGSLNAVTSGSTARDIGSTVNVLNVGLSYIGSAPLVGDISALITGAYAPTSAQIKSWYDSEKGLFKKYAALQVAGEEYTVETDSEAIDPSENTIGNTGMSLGGSSELIIDRDEAKWSMKTSILDGETTELSEFKEFIYSARGETFTFDPYGTIAVPDEPRLCYLDSRNHPQERVGVMNKFKIPYMVREV